MRDNLAGRLRRRPFRPDARGPAHHPYETDLMKQLNFPGRIRVGPDWFALVSNWMTEWERTGDTKWRDRILVGVKDMAKMPYGIRTGRNLVAGWNPVTADLYPLI